MKIVSFELFAFFSSFLLQNFLFLSPSISLIRRFHWFQPTTIAIDARSQALSSARKREKS